MQRGRSCGIRPFNELSGKLSRHTCHRRDSLAKSAFGLDFLCHSFNMLGVSKQDWRNRTIFMTLHLQPSVTDIRQAETRPMAQKVLVGSLFLGSIFLLAAGTIAVAAF